LKSTNYSDPTDIKSHGNSPSSTREDREMTDSLVIRYWYALRVEP